MAALAAGASWSDPAAARSLDLDSAGSDLPLLLIVLAAMAAFTLVGWLLSRREPSRRDR